MSSKLGILAGGGDLPARLIQVCRQTGRPYFVIAIEDQMDPALISSEIPHAWVRLGAAGEAIERLRAENVEELVMAGRVKRPGLSSLKPDSWTAKFFAKVGLKALGDDGLLKSIVAALETEGFRVVGPESVITDLLAPAGVCGAVTPDHQAEDDIARGVEVAHGLGGLDVGQAVVVQQGLVLA
ncbi:MAG: UDP-2,3-diacylglucosamine diphosphatase LpxI, partial [Rhodospirillales bacterium]